MDAMVVSITLIIMEILIMNITAMVVTTVVVIEVFICSTDDDHYSSSHGSEGRDGFDDCGCEAYRGNTVGSWSLI